MLLLLVACASSAPSIRVDAAWSRATAGSGPAAVYFSIVNDGGRPDRLVGVRSPCCGALEIHRTRVIDDRMSMAPVEEDIVVAPGSTFAFAPGGYHLMLFDVHEPLSAGGHFPLTLEFEHSGEVSIEVEVR